jgi:ribonuclease HII
MVERSSAAPQYRWHENKGYSAPDHLAALAADGPCAQHRRSWSLPGVDGGPALIDLADLVDLAEAADDVELTDAEFEDDDGAGEGEGARRIRGFAALGHDERR